MLTATAEQLSLGPADDIRVGTSQVFFVEGREISVFRRQRGAITALIGPNGAGKTTFFNLLTGFDQPQEGSWRFNDKDLSGMPSYKVARLGMVRTFQLTKGLLF